MLLAAQEDMFGLQQGCMHGRPRLRVARTPAEDVIDYNNSLRMGILECYSGMLNGLTKKKANQLLLPYAPVSSWAPPVSWPSLCRWDAFRQSADMSADWQCAETVPNPVVLTELIGH